MVIEQNKVDNPEKAIIQTNTNTIYEKQTTQTTE